jgi:CheY-like chemotaxis protein
LSVRKGYSEDLDMNGVNSREVALAQKIMIVDDSEDMRLLIGILLRPEGFQVSEARNGSEAVDLIAAESAPDLILLDHNMPVMDGPEFLKVLKEKHPEIYKRVPVVLLTGLDSNHVSCKGAAEVIAKQSGIEPLLAVVEKYLHPSQ